MLLLLCQLLQRGCCGCWPFCYTATGAVPGVGSRLKSGGALVGQYGAGMLDRAWAGMGVYESWRGAQHPSYRADAERAEVSRA